MPTRCPRSLLPALLLLTAGSLAQTLPPSAPPSTEPPSAASSAPASVPDAAANPNPSAPETPSSAPVPLPPAAGAAQAAQDFLARWYAPAPIHLDSLKQRAMVLTYHDVIPDRSMKGAVWFDATVAELEEQITTLRARGANFITLAQLYDHLSSGAPLPDKAVALTFDDNYQYFHDYGYPILKKYGLPFAMFVHTNYVGSQVGRPKMTYETLRAMLKDGLMTMGSHSESHPEDLGKMPEDKQIEELLGSKELLEKNLGVPVEYVSYPNGAFSTLTLEVARKVGFRLGFTEEWQPAEAGYNLLGVPRYINVQWNRAWNDSENGRKTAAVFQTALQPTPVRLETKTLEGVDMAFIRGGSPKSLLSGGRHGVREFVDALGARAGINGAFFTDALVASSDNTMIGPVLTRTLAAPHEAQFKPEQSEGLLERTRERPLVVWGPQNFMVVPFQPDRMNTLEGLRALMPDATDAFLAGAWIVRGGVAQMMDNLEPMAPRDAGDRRPRVFLGITKDGEMVLGASRSPASTEMLARAASSAGVDEAVLLDSGYSTSLVYGQDFVAVGRKRAAQPSRPVPHAIVLMQGG